MVVREGEDNKQWFSGQGYRTDTHVQFPIFVEPREAKRLEEMLNDYYTCISSRLNDYYTCISSRPGGKAILLAVARGKVSEAHLLVRSCAAAKLFEGLGWQ